MQALVAELSDSEPCDPCCSGAVLRFLGSFVNSSLSACILRCLEVAAPGPKLWSLGDV